MEGLSVFIKKENKARIVNKNLQLPITAGSQGVLC